MIRSPTPRLPLLRGPELSLLLLILVLSASLWAFAKLADEVMEGETRAFDRAVLLAMREPDDPAQPRGPTWLGEAMKDITALGSMTVLTLVTLAVAGYLWLVGRARLALILALSVAGGAALAFGMKSLFDRGRPTIVPHIVETVTASFPSGHSMMSAVVYLTLGALLASTHERRTERAYLIGVFGGVAVLVGTSRIYLGVHWPTDVLAGWSAGAAWSMLSLLAAKLTSPRAP